MAKTSGADDDGVQVAMLGYQNHETGALDGAYNLRIVGRCLCVRDHLAIFQKICDMTNVFILA